MLRCSESTMSCICSSVGRLTVDMGPPNDVTAAGVAGAAMRDRPLRAEADDEVVRAAADERTLAADVSRLIGARGKASAGGTTVSCGRGRAVAPPPVPA